MLQEIRVQTGVESPELKSLPELPAAAAHVWGWYCDLTAARSAGFQVNPILWADIGAYFRLMDMSPERWEIYAIRDLDNAFLLSRLDKPTQVIHGAKALKNKMTGQAGA